MIFQFALIAVGTALLYYGAESLVRGSSSFAFRIGISPLVVGLIIVGFGTSMPEFVLSIDASMRGYNEISLGNVVGSNICNIGLILGLTAMIKPIKVNSRLVRYDAPIMMGVTILFIVLALDGYFTWWKGVIFLIGLVVYMVTTVRFTHNKKGLEETLHEAEEDTPALTKSVLVDWIIIFAGLTALWFGSRFFVSGVVSLADALGISNAVIGLSVVAFGTSLPELATSLVAIARNHRDLAIGNIIGSNIFNILAIIGSVSLIKPFEVKEINWVDYVVLFIFSAAIIPFMRNDKIISRKEGLSLFVGYIFYMAYLYLFQNQALRSFN